MICIEWIRYIRRIKEFQDKSFAKILALAVTAGITFGQGIMTQVSELMFDPVEEAVEAAPVRSELGALYLSRHHRRHWRSHCCSHSHNRLAH